MPFSFRKCYWRLNFDLEFIVGLRNEFTFIGLVQHIDGNCIHKKAKLKINVVRLINSSQMTGSNNFNKKMVSKNVHV